MRLPPGLSATFSSGSTLSSSPLVCHLQKSLYGLRQASRWWYVKLSQALCSRGYSPSLNDYSLFSRKSDSSTVLLAVYIDDIILTINDLAEITALKSFLDNEFKIKDLGVLNYFLGIEVAYIFGGLLLHQRKFIKDLLKEYHCENVTHVTCLFDLTVKLRTDMGDHLPSPESYRSLVGKLNFLTHTRLDLAFAVQHLSQYLQKPTFSHMHAALHILRYHQGSSKVGVFISNFLDLSLSAYCDSDWVACPDTRRLVTRFCILLGGAHLLLVGLLSDFGIPVSVAIPILCDNQTVIHIVKNLVFHARTKHIEVDFYFIRAKLHEGLIALNHVPTTSQLADVFTKPLTGLAHHSLLLKLGVQSPFTLKGVLELSKS
uniref:Uncharacterized mitochondrial protein AtMg00810-like n=1 Tax=Nicotiana tabacum TaxID=4097 RepID=A0A1S4AU25_TOBAC|nr:PREDICTED: uncharacterized mitochondrial protein AtMg00810-like [Nicotiana tabacum]